MTFKDKINTDKLPSHIAIIMDGNGRWAQQRGLDRIFGHQQGVNSLREIIEAAAELGVNYLTLYAFSTENWSRPDDEVNALMGIMVRSLNNETDTLLKNNIRLKIIGDVERLTNDVRDRLEQTLEVTSSCTGLNLIVGLSYSSRWEITDAVRRLAFDVYRGVLIPDTIDEQLISYYLSTRNIPDPELLIRTSGELRISNFLLWQLAYTELYFTDILWPDFGKEDFYKAIADYQTRERRFGKTSEQILEK
ncbi:MAG TPA: isoprenyl transferase [Bacteroidales bacterium]|nr:isoprenyl transferase [Bacteroidales bacterium]